jgi:hypothetical protein
VTLAQLGQRVLLAPPEMTQTMVAKVASDLLAVSVMLEVLGFQGVTVRLCEADGPRVSFFPDLTSTRLMPSTSILKRKENSQRSLNLID